MSDLKEISKYIYDNKALVLSTVDELGNPQLRSIGGYSLDGKDIVFQTGINTDKTRDIAHNNNVTLLFQHEGQQLPKNITVYGKANKLDGDEAKRASGLIKERRPQINFDPHQNIIYKVEVESAKLLDFAADEKLQIIPASQLV